MNKSCLKEILSFSRGMYGLPIMMLLFVQMDSLSSAVSCLWKS